MDSIIIIIIGLLAICFRYVIINTLNRVEDLESKVEELEKKVILPKITHTKSKTSEYPDHWRK